MVGVAQLERKGHSGMIILSVFTFFSAGVIADYRGGCVYFTCLVHGFKLFCE